MMKITTDMIHRDLRKYANVVLNNQPLLNSITAIRERDRNLKRKFCGKWFGKTTHMQEQEILIKKNVQVFYGFMVVDMEQHYQKNAIHMRNVS